MKIALLRALPDPGRFSMDLYADELAKALRPYLRAEDSLICFPDSFQPLSRQIDLETFGGKLKRYWQQYWEYGRALRRLDADIYHILDHGYAHLIPFLPEKKFIVTFHDALLPSMAEKKIPVSKRPWKAIWAQRYSLKCLGNAGAVIADSEFSKKELLRYCPFPIEKAHVVYPGVNPIFFQPADPQAILKFRYKWNLEGSQTLVISGRTDPHKNMEGAFRVASQLRAIGLPIVLIKIGSAFTPEQQVLIQKLQLGPFVREIGCLMNEELPLVYQSSDALLFLSWYEGFGFPALEAMASGIPVIVSNRGSLPEIVREAGKVVNPENIQETLQDLRNMLTSPSMRDSLVRKGRERAALFSWQQTAACVLNVYHEVYNKRIEQAKGVSHAATA